MSVDDKDLSHTKENEPATPPVSTHPQADISNNPPNSNANTSTSPEPLEPSTPTNPTLQSILRRLEVIEGSSSIQRTFSPFSHAHILLQLKMDLLLKLQRPLKQPLCSTQSSQSPFGKILRPSSMCLYTPCTLSSFTSLCEHITKDIKYKSGEDFFLYPKTLDIKKPPRGSGHLAVILFSLTHLLTVLDIRDKRDYNRVLRSVYIPESDNVVPVVRLLGGFQGDLEDSQNPQSLFVGSSCYNLKCAESENLSVGNLKALSLRRETSLWDTNNYYFQHNLDLEHTNNLLDYCNSDSFCLDDLSAFLFTWTPATLPSSRIWTRDALDMGTFTPGSLRLTLPVLTFSGNRRV